MKTLHLALFTCLVFIVFGNIVYAQNSEQTDLLKKAKGLFNERKYPEAEVNVIDAIKININNADCQLLYADIAMSQNKRLCALMGYCSFLILEPQSERALTAWKQIQKILKNAGSPSKSNMINIPGESPAMQKAENAIEQGVAKSKEMRKWTIGTENDQLAAMFSIIFRAAGREAYKMDTKDFFWTFYADFFNGLANTDLMPAFTSLISASYYKEETNKWFIDNPNKLAALNNWEKNYIRIYE